jgi:hypothetical protein
MAHRVPSTSARCMAFAISRLRRSFSFTGGRYGIFVRGALDW